MHPHNVLSSEATGETQERSDRYFHVDILQDKARAGIKLKTSHTGTYIAGIERNSEMEKWNVRCAKTFPEDQVRNGDQIIYINKECDHSKFGRIKMRDSS